MEDEAVSEAKKILANFNSEDVKSIMEVAVSLKELAGVGASTSLTNAQFVEVLLKMKKKLEEIPVPPTTVKDWRLVMKVLSPSGESYYSCVDYCGPTDNGELVIHVSDEFTEDPNSSSQFWEFVDIVDDIVKKDVAMNLHPHISIGETGVGILLCIEASVSEKRKIVCFNCVNVKEFHSPLAAAYAVHEYTKSLKGSQFEDSLLSLLGG